MIAALFLSAQSFSIHRRSSAATSCHVQRKRCVRTMRPELYADLNAAIEGRFILIPTAQRIILYSCACNMPMYATRA